MTGIGRSPLWIIVSVNFSLVGSFKMFSGVSVVIQIATGLAIGYRYVQLALSILILFNTHPFVHLKKTDQYKLKPIVYQLALVCWCYRIGTTNFQGLHLPMIVAKPLRYENVCSKVIQ